MFCYMFVMILSLLKRGVQELHEFKRMVISIFGISHDIEGGNEGWYIITYLTVDLMRGT